MDTSSEKTEVDRGPFVQPPSPAFCLLLGNCMRGLRARLVVLLVLTAAFIPHEAAAASPLLPQVTHIKLEVRVDLDEERLDGEATLVVQNASSQPIDAVPILLNRLLQVASVRDGKGVDIPFHQQVRTFDEFGKWQVNSTIIRLPFALEPGQSTKIQIGYGGFLTGYTEVGMQYIKDHIDRNFTILREDAFAFPVVGVPSVLENRRSSRSAFGYEVLVTVPDGVVVASGGSFITKTEKDGWYTWHYLSESPAPFLLIAIAPYEVAKADNFRVFHFPQDASGAHLLLTAARQSIDRLAGIFGPLGSEPSLSIMEIPDGWGSQASLTGGIIQERGAFLDRARLGELYHELSHLWNVPDLDVPSSRWNEGLAMFLQDRLSQELHGSDPTENWQRTATRLIDDCSKESPCGQSALREYGREGITDMSYLVGRLMFAALYTVMGQEDFDRALKSHFETFGASGGFSEDLANSFVAIGGQKAQRVIDEWLTSTLWLERIQSSESLKGAFDSYSNVMEAPERRRPRHPDGTQPPVR